MYKDLIQQLQKIIPSPELIVHKKFKEKEVRITKLVGEISSKLEQDWDDWRTKDEPQNYFFPVIYIIEREDFKYVKPIVEIFKIKWEVIEESLANQIRLVFRKK